VALLLVRRTPESIGIPSDHVELKPAGSAREREIAAATFTLSQALRTRAFWTFALAAAVFNLIFSGVALFSEAILRERRFYDAATFRASMGILAMGGILANFLGGYLAGKMSLHRLMALGMLTVTASLVLLPFATTRAAVFAYATLMGLAGGIVTVVFFACWPKIFGRTHLGKVQGAAQVLTVVFSAAGPGLLALGERHQGSFARTFLLMAPVVGALAIACWSVRMPRQPAP
jgi:sugar phosphate permease